jgi:hypothetical protein
MSSSLESSTISSDPAAIFACASSLHKACLEVASAEPALDLSEAYNGMDEFMRELMRIAKLFEGWACVHIAFDELNEVWPYFLEDRFGVTCLEILPAIALREFDEADCLRVALRLRLPVRADLDLRVPVDLQATNPVLESEFRAFRIQTVRNEVQDGDVSPFTVDDDPFDENFGTPYFSLYGINRHGLLEHISDRQSYGELLSLAQKLAPGIDLPSKPVFRTPQRVP